MLRLTEGFATAWLVYALIDTGDHAAAEEELVAATPMIGPGAPFIANYLLSARGRLRLAQGRYDEAVTDLQECGRRAAAWGATGPALCRWRAHLALALFGRGDREAAAQAGAEALRAARAWDTPFLVAEASSAAGLTTADPQAGLTLLREAVVAAAESGSPLEEARALVALGGALRRSGSRSAARAPLRAALDLALRCGAGAVAGTAHDGLVAAGSRPRRLRSTGVGALTAVERRVAAMVADGLTNRTVAQALFVSEKTVETHLGHAYRKLAISSRTQLGSALAAATSGG